MKIKVAACFVSSLMGLVEAAAKAEDSAFSGASAPVTPVEFRTGNELPSWGTASLTSLVMGAYNFSVRDSSMTWAAAGGGFRSLTSAGGVLDAVPMLPNGSQVEWVEIEACDTSATASILVNFGPARVVMEEVVRWPVPWRPGSLRHRVAASTLRR